MKLHEIFTQADVFAYIGLEIGRGFIGLGSIADYWPMNVFKAT